MLFSICYLHLRRHLKLSISSIPRHLSLSTMQSQQKATLDVSPPIHRCRAGDTSINKSLFRKTVSVLAAQVTSSQTGTLLKSDALKGFVINLSKVRTVVPGPTDDLQRLLLLRVTQENELTGEAREFLKERGASFVHHDLHFDYDYWTADEILGALLPEELCAESPTGFAMTGHIAHLNLRDEYLPFKHVIGQVILDKNPKVKTVVNKIDTISNQFRVFDMELIAGEPEYVVEHHESDCRFTFDFRKVYWNSRLHTEHDRLVQIFRPEDGVIADVFAGVGPFAVPAGKKGCAVLANDLNPNSFKWLQKNISDNNTSASVRAYCEDGRDFIRSSFLRAYDEPFSTYSGPKPSKRKLKELQRQGRGAAPICSAPGSEKRNRICHFVMNLPDSAIEFLDAFRGVLSQGTLDLRSIYDEMPMVHCHCFTRFLDPGEAEADIKKRVAIALGQPVEEDVRLHLVRSVAPNKEMYCISFRLPKAVVYSV